MGKIIAVEGIDGSGKGTQCKLVCSALVNLGYSATIQSFPEYRKHFFGREVGRFLNGEFGTLSQVHPKLASLLYAGDRFESVPNLLLARTNFDFVICDRYTPSNMAHQAAKILDLGERGQFEDWVYQLEHEVFSIPVPDKVVLLDMAPEISGKLVEMKEKRSYTEKKKDLHESDSEYLQTVREIYLDLAAKNNWTVVNCSKDGKPLHVDKICGVIVESLVSNAILEQKTQAST